MEQNSSIEIVRNLLIHDSHPRAIARELGVSHTTVQRKIKELLSGNVLDYRIEGKNTVYFLKRTIEARIYMYMAEWYTLGETIEQLPQLRFIIKIIQDRRDISLAILFGSYAKGTSREASDIDIYIETTDISIKREIERHHSKVSVKIGLFDTDTLLIQEIMKNHVILKGVERYYEATEFFEQTL